MLGDLKNRLNVKYCISIFLVFFLLPLAAFSNIPENARCLIVKKVIKKNKVTFTLPKEFYSTYIISDFFISFPQEIKLKSLPSSIVDTPLIMNVIAMIWISGQDYYVDEMDEDLYYSLIKIKEFFRRYHCNTEWSGRLLAKRLVKNIPPTSTSQPAMLFTHGLDSTTTLFRHWEEKPTLILYINTRRNNKSSIGKLAKFVNDYGLTTYPIATNFLSFLNEPRLNNLTPDIDNWRMGAIEGLGWVGMVVPLLYSKGISLLYIAAGVVWEDGYFQDGQTRHSICNIIVDENVSIAELKVVHDGFHMTRDDKVEYICSYCSDHNISKPKFIIDDNMHGNCSKCDKCFRTMNSILAEGEDPRSFGFALSPSEFIEEFSLFLKTGTFNRRLYTYHRVTQRKIEKNIDSLSPQYHFYYKWFISIDLWAKVNEIDNRPERKIPFTWKLFCDLYPDIPEDNFERYPY